MKRFSPAAIIQTSCVLAAYILMVKPGAASVLSDYSYTGPQFALSRTCTASDCSSVAAPAFDIVQAFIQFNTDTSNVSGTFSVGGLGEAIALMSSDAYGGVLNSLGSVTLSAGKITAWSLLASASARTAFWTLTTSNEGDSSSYGFEIFDPIIQDFGSASGEGSGPPGVWSGPAIVILGEPETPLPAALPLFVTGLGALGLLGWRRNRKAALAA